MSVIRYVVRIMDNSYWHSNGFAGVYVALDEADAQRYAATVREPRHAYVLTETHRSVMCGTCGFETEARHEDEANRRHMRFDPAHEASWYEDGDVSKAMNDDWTGHH